MSLELRIYIRNKNTNDKILLNYYCKSIIKSLIDACENVSYLDDGEEYKILQVDTIWSIIRYYEELIINTKEIISRVKDGNNDYLLKASQSSDSKTAKALLKNIQTIKEWEEDLEQYNYLSCEWNMIRLIYDNLDKKNYELIYTSC